MLSFRVQRQGKDLGLTITSDDADTGRFVLPKQIWNIRVDSKTTVVSGVVSGGVSDLAGVRVNDILVSINGRLVVDMTHKQTVGLLIEEETVSARLIIASLTRWSSS